MNRLLLLFCCITGGVLWGQDIPWRKITQAVRNPDRDVFNDCAFIPYFEVIGPVANQENSEDIPYEYFSISSLLQYSALPNGSTSFFQLNSRLTGILESEPEKNNKIQDALTQLKREGMIEFEKYYTDQDSSSLSDGQLLAYWLHSRANPKEAIGEIYNSLFLVKRDMIPAQVTSETGKFLLHLGRPFMVKTVAGSPLIILNEEETFFICLGYDDQDNKLLIADAKTVTGIYNSPAMSRFQQLKKAKNISEWDQKWVVEMEEKIRMGQVQTYYEDYFFRASQTPFPKFIFEREIDSFSGSMIVVFPPVLQWDDIL